MNPSIESFGVVIFTVLLLNWPLFISMYFIVKNLRRQIEIPPDKFGQMINVRLS